MVTRIIMRDSGTGEERSTVGLKIPDEIRRGRLTITETARLFEVSVPTVRSRISDGSLSAERIAGLSHNPCLIDPNEAERVLASRTRSGEQHPRAKFSSRDIEKIREYYADGDSISWLADAYGVDYKTIHGIVVGSTWRDPT